MKRSRSKSKSKCGCSKKVKVDIPTSRVSTPNPKLRVGKNNPFTGRFA